MKFGIQIEERYCKTVVVEADSIEEAQEKVDQAMADGDVSLGYDDYSGWDAIPAPRWEGRPIPEEEDVSIYDTLK